MKKKILFVVTSHDKIGDTNTPTGYHLAEVTHPWEVLVDAGYEIDFVSPKGGTPPVDSFDMKDPTNERFWHDPVYKKKIDNSLKPADIDTADYGAIYFAGGHGTMWDLPDNEALAKIAAAIYENGGVVGAVCHGPAGLVNVLLSDGKFLVDGKKVNSFTNQEETAVKLDNIVPFLLEDRLVQRGGLFEKSELWQSHVAVDQRLITGQNPQSAKGVGEAMLRKLNNETVSQ